MTILSNYRTTNLYGNFKDFHTKSTLVYTYTRKMGINILFYKGRLKIQGLKISYDDVISSVDEVFLLMDPSTATPSGEMCRKRNLLCSHSMREFWSAHELFSRPSFVRMNCFSMERLDLLLIYSVLLCHVFQILQQILLFREQKLIYNCRPSNMNIFL